MPTNRKRRGHHARSKYPPLITAILTDAPLPPSFSAWDAYKVENPDSPGLIGIPEHVWSLADAWCEFHGRAMTDADRARVAARVPELRAAKAARHAQRSLATTVRDTPAPGSTSPSNWPEEEQER